MCSNARRERKDSACTTIQTNAKQFNHHLTLSSTDKYKYLGITQKLFYKVKDNKKKTVLLELVQYIKKYYLKT